MRSKRGAIALAEDGYENGGTPQRYEYKRSDRPANQLVAACVERDDG